MTAADWIRTTGTLALADINSIPTRLRYRVRATLAAFFRFQCRKVCEEESLFFKLLFMPIIMMEKVPLRIRAYRRGLSLDVFLRLDMAELRVESEMLKQIACLQRIKQMERLADVMPGATVNDYEDLIEGRPFWLLMFLRNSFWKLILGDNDKKED